jgi:hypothetical protein
MLTDKCCACTIATLVVAILPPSLQTQLTLVPLRTAATMAEPNQQCMRRAARPPLPAAIMATSTSVDRGESLSQTHVTQLFRGSDAAARKNYCKMVPSAKRRSLSASRSL